MESYFSFCFPEAGLLATSSCSSLSLWYLRLGEAGVSPLCLPLSFHPRFPLDCTDLDDPPVFSPSLSLPLPPLPLSLSLVHSTHYDPLSGVLGSVSVGLLGSLVGTGF